MSLSLAALSFLGGLADRLISLLGDDMEVVWGPLDGIDLPLGAVSLRAWRVVGDVPVAIGVIDAKVSEPGFMWAFLDEMPVEGELERIFYVRPIDSKGRELGMEIRFSIAGANHALMEARKHRLSRGDWVSDWKGRAGMVLSRTSSWEVKIDFDGHVETVSARDVRRLTTLEAMGLGT